MMKRLRLVAASLTLAALLAPGAASAQVRWQSDIDRALEQSVVGGQPVLLEFWATWCAACKTMDEEVFSQERVATAMRKVLPVRVDIDAQTARARKYGVEGTPTLIVTDGHGNELLRHGGYLAADSLVALLDELPGDLTPLHTLAAALKKDRNDFDALRALGDRLREHSLYRASNEYYRRALKTSRGRERSEARAAILLAVAANHTALQEDEEAAKATAQYRRDFPGRY